MSLAQDQKGSGGFTWLKPVITHLVMVAAGALLFAAAFPNLLFENGLPLLAWIAYIPVVWLLYQVSIGASVFYGALFGYAAYGLFNYWLSVFHPLADDAVGAIYLVYFALFFPLLKLAIILFPKRGYLVQWLLWVAFEYLRTLGFLGYSYGITGYSQWRLIPLIQIADTFGVWGVSALVIFPSVYLAAILGGTRTGGGTRVWVRRGVPLLIWLAALLGTLIYGAASRIDYTDAPTKKIALVQHNTDPWRGDMAEYRRNYQVLRRLSDEAMELSPDLDLIVWSETAFVPRIYWHITYRDHQESYLLVKELLDYLASRNVPFVIGNDDARREPAKNPKASEKYRVDYNAAMLYDKGTEVAVYRKFHLVPFTESFPYEKQLPLIYNALRAADTHFWEHGNEASVMEINGLRFSSPICFEDTFGYLSRDFVRNGAELLVNLSNDAWARSLPAQNQHLSMAVFRAVENRRSMVRSTASGQTAAIDPNGKVIAMAAPFVETQLTVAVPIVTPAARYTRYGDFLPQVALVVALTMLLIGIARTILLKAKIKTGGHHGLATTEDTDR